MTSHTHSYTAIFCAASILSASMVPAAALAGSAMNDARNMAAAVGEHVDTDTLVHYTTGINPQDYPCARAKIAHVYEQRSQIADLSEFHPKRAFAWVTDTMTYYGMRIIDFFKRLMNPDALGRGVAKMRAMANGGNPLSGMDRKVEGWVSDLSPKSEFVLKRKVHDIIGSTTNEDGSCKG